MPSDNPLLAQPTLSSSLIEILAATGTIVGAPKKKLPPLLSQSVTIPKSNSSPDAPVIAQREALPIVRGYHHSHYLLASWKLNFPSAVWTRLFHSLSKWLEGSDEDSDGYDFDDYDDGDVNYGENEIDHDGDLRYGSD